ncbi:MAG: tetratricopeptide repeat protein [Magnetococcus sp. DMHC-1]
MNQKSRKSASHLVTGLLFVLNLLIIGVAWPKNAGGADLYAPEEVFAYARELEKQGDHGRAATEFGRYVSFARRVPKNAPHLPQLEEAMYRLAVNLSQAGELDAALRAFASLGEAFPQSRHIPQALLRMGLIYEQGKDVEESKRRYQKLVAMDPDSEWAALASLRLAWLSLEQPGEDAIARQYLQAVTHARYVKNAQSMLREMDALPLLPYKDSWVAGSLSALLPGAGHLYLERPRDAGFAFLSNGLLVAGTYQAFSRGISGLGAALAMVELGWYSGTVFSAVSLTHRHNQKLRHDYLNLTGSLLQADSQAVGVEMTWRY